MSSRCCSRTACKHPPVYTLTYVYRDSTAVLGPLAAYVEPHCYDLCEKHAARLIAPRGWDVVRLPVEPVQDRADDLEALANAVMEAQPRARPDNGSRRSPWARASRSAAGVTCGCCAPGRPRTDRLGSAVRTWTAQVVSREGRSRSG